MDKGKKLVLYLRSRYGLSVDQIKNAVKEKLRLEKAGFHLSFPQILLQRNLIAPGQFKELSHLIRHEVAVCSACGTEFPEFSTLPPDKLAEIPCETCGRPLEYRKKDRAGESSPESPTLFAARGSASAAERIENRESSEAPLDQFPLEAPTSDLDQWSGNESLEISGGAELVAAPLGRLRESSAQDAASVPALPVAAGDHGASHGSGAPRHDPAPLGGREDPDPLHADEVADVLQFDWEREESDFFPDSPPPALAGDLPEIDLGELDGPTPHAPVIQTASSREEFAFGDPQAPPVLEGGFSGRDTAPALDFGPFAGGADSPYPVEFCEEAESFFPETPKIDADLAIDISDYRDAAFDLDRPGYPPRELRPPSTAAEKGSPSPDPLRGNRYPPGPLRSHGSPASGADERTEILEREHFAEPGGDGADHDTARTLITGDLDRVGVSSSATTRDTARTLIAREGSGPLVRPSSSSSRARTPSSVTEFNPGDRFGSFQIIDVLRHGAIGKVYMAKDLDLDRTVALKMIKEGDEEAWEHEQRFLREVEVIANLDHPNIISIYNGGSHLGYKFFTMEHIKGQTLEESLQMNVMNLRKGLRIMRDIVHAIQYAHSKGVVHRDLKPESIHIDEAGIPHITDFWLAKASDSPNITYQGWQAAPSPYSSPEQRQGLSEVDERSDIFSLGAILYHVVCGKIPYHDPVAPRPDYGKALPPPHQINPEVPPEISTLCMKSLAVSPQDRYATAGEMANLLEDYLEEGLARQRSKKRPRRARSWLPWAAGILLLAGGGVGLALAMKAREGEEGKPSSKSEPEQTSPEKPPVARLTPEEYAALIEKLISERRLKEAREKTVEALDLHPDSAELSGLKEKIDRLVVDENTGAQGVGQAPPAGARGLLTIRTGVPGATVQVQPVKDFRLGAARNLGVTPIERTQLEFGHYRLTIRPRGADEPSVVFPIKLEKDAARREVVVEIKVPERIPTGMVFVPQGEYLSGKFKSPREVDAFFLDRSPVTNRQYMEFLTSYPRLRPPPHWRNGRYPRSRGQHPVTSVSPSDATFYALWNGKRLPSRWEFEKARRGIDGRQFPWGDVFSPTLTTTRESGGRSTVPVDSHPEGLSPYGCSDMYGNVLHLTDMENGPQPGISVINLGGCAFDVSGTQVKAAEPAQLSLRVQSGQAPNMRYRNVGFRCARSVIDRIDENTPMKDLVSRLRSEFDPGNALELMRLIGERGGMEAVEVILPKVSDTNPLTRLGAQLRLLRVKGVDLFQTFTTRFWTPEHRERALAVLRFMQTPQVMQFLLGQLDSLSAAHQQLAQQILAGFPHPSVTRVLLAAFPKARNFQTLVAIMNHMVRVKEKGAIPIMRRFCRLPPNFGQLPVNQRNVRLNLAVQATVSLLGLGDVGPVREMLEKGQQLEKLLAVFGLGRFPGIQIPFASFKPLLGGQVSDQLSGLLLQYFLARAPGVDRLPADPADRTLLAGWAERIEKSSSNRQLQQVARALRQRLR